MTGIAGLVRSSNRAHRSVLASVPENGFEAYEISSAHDGIICARADDGMLVHQSPGSTPANRNILLLWLPEAPQIGFLAASDEPHLAVGLHEDTFRVPLLSLRLSRNGGARTIAFRHPLAERYVCAGPLGDTPTPLVADRATIGGWETFRRGPTIPSPRLALAISLALSSVVPILRSAFCTSAVIDWLANEPEETLAVVGQSLLRLAAPDTLAAIGAAVLQIPGLAEKMSNAWPASPGMKGALPELQRWTRRRIRRNRIEVGPDLDPLANAVRFGAPCLDLTLHLHAAARRRVEPTRSVAIVATARNEGPYLVDWLAHHRAVGVEHFFIYSSEDNDDGSDQLLSCLADGGVITFLRNRVATDVSRQIKAYNHAFLRVSELLDFRWTATIDLDEYLVVDPTKFISLVDFLDLQEARGAESVSLNWRMFGSDRQTTFADRPFAERFARREPTDNRHVKTIVRSNRVWGTLHHAPLWPDRVQGLGVDALGKPHYCPGLIGGIGAFREAEETGPAWVNHYFMRSLPECVMKYGRSSADDPRGHELRFNAKFVEGFLDGFNRTDLVEDSTILANSGLVSQERDELMRKPGVAAAHAVCVSRTGEAMRRLVRDIPAHADELPDNVRENYLALVTGSIAAGVVEGSGRTQTPLA